MHEGHNVPDVVETTEVIGRAIKRRVEIHSGDVTVTVEPEPGASDGWLVKSRSGKTYRPDLESAIGCAVILSSRMRANADGDYCPYFPMLHRLPAMG